MHDKVYNIMVYDLYEKTEMRQPRAKSLKFHTHTKVQQRNEIIFRVYTFFG